MTAIRVELQLSDGSFSSGMLRAGQSVAGFQKELARLDPNFRKLSQSGAGAIQSIKKLDVESRSLLSTLRDVSIVSGAVYMVFNALTGAGGGMIGSINAVNAEFQRLKFQMMSMSTSVKPIEEAGVAVDYLRAKAKLMPFSMREITNSFVKLKTTGTDPMTGSLQALADGIAAFGGTDESLHRVTLGITQMSGKGVIQMEELRQQLGESMPNAMRLMARSMGVSVAELTKAISTGQVEAKGALASFYQELDRTYGGEARRMMQTFSGQVSRLKTSLQQLVSTEGGGMESFFNAEGEALTALNDFLSGNQAQYFADSLGQALEAVIRGMTEATKIAYGLRNEIATLAKVGAGLIAFKAMTSGVMGLAGSFTLLKMQVGSSMAMMTTGFADMRTNIAGVMAGQNAATGLGLAFMGAKQGIAGFLATAARTIPVVGGLAVAIYMAADYFGILGNKAKSAYEEIEQFGAKSGAEALRVSQEYEAKLRRNLETTQQINPTDFWGNANPEIAALEAEIKRVQDARAKLVSQGAQTERDILLKMQGKILEDDAAKIQKEYRNRQTALDQKYEEELRTTEESEESQKQIRDRYQADTLESRMTLSQGTISIYDKELKRLTELTKTETGERLRTVEAMIAQTQEKRLEEAAKLDNMRQMGITLMPSIQDEESKIEKGRKTLDGLTATITDLQAELEGADGAFAEMQFRINRGDFGSISDGVEATKLLHDQLLAATAQKEALDELMKGDKAITEDLARLREKNIEREMELTEELNGKKFTESERIAEKLKNGMYAGLGPIDNIRKAIDNVTQNLTLQGTVTDQVGIAIRENAFGSQSIKTVNDMRTAIDQLNGSVLGLGTALGNINFDNFNSGSLTGMTRDMSGFRGNMLDLIAKGESRESDYGGYNTTLDNGRWTGGPKDLVKMTLDEILQLGDKMRTPENRATYAGGGSSALGRYQIVGSTLRGLMKEMGLNGQELFSPAMQDQLATRLLQQTGGDVGTLRKVWTSLANVGSSDIVAAWNRDKADPTGKNAPKTDLSLPSAAPPKFDFAAVEAERERLIADRVARQAEIEKQLQIEGEKEESNRTLAQQVEKKKFLDEMIAKTRSAGDDITDLGTNLAKLFEAIKGGKLGDNKDVNAKEYADLVKAARELDRVEKEIAATKKASGDADSAKVELDKQRLEISRQIVEEQSKVKDPDFEGVSSAMTKLTADLDEYVANVKRAYGADSAAYKEALEYRQQALSGQLKLEAEEKRAGFAQESRDLEESMMTQGQARNAALQRDLERIDRAAEAMRKAGMSEVQITEETEKMKALIKQKYAMETNPVTKQMQEWGDIQGNLMEKTTGWMDAAADGITGLIMGTGDFGSAVKGILADLVNTHVKNMMSNIVGNKASSAVGGKFGGGAGAAGKMGGKGGGGMSKLGMLVGIAHTGGIAGGRLSTRRASAGMFHGAPKFHGGGIVGMPKLNSMEVPIIAKKNEGVFTPEQMSHLAPAGQGAGQAIQINAPITVNGSAGTPQQNDDLAQKMAKELEGTMRGAVQDEVRKMIRPGSMLNTRQR